MTHLLPQVRVLVAEDDPQMRGLLDDVLTAHGFAVETLRDGHDLLAALTSAFLAETAEPDLILSDNFMPGRCGLDVLQGIREAGWTTPFVLMTAYATPEVRERVAALGGSVVAKPFDVDALAAGMLAGFRRRSRRDGIRIPAHAVGSPP